MNLLYSSVICLLLLLSWTTAGGQTPDNRISLGQRDSVYSQILQENRRLLIYVPSAANRPDPKVQYPVVYLLDGGINFVSFVGALQYLSEVNLICPRMIVVGILNTDRMRDLTPTHYTSPRADSLQFQTSGGGETFTRFLEKELIPYMEAHYPTSPERLLIGHSLGGLLVVHTLLHHTALFKHYLAIDPSLTWDEQRLLPQYLALLPPKTFTQQSFF